jgi:glycosyltransferase involved in cell wall biosynthesis
MASGCPCIVADTGGLGEVVPHDEHVLRFDWGEIASETAALYEQLCVAAAGRDRCAVRDVPARD